MRISAINLRGRERRVSECSLGHEQWRLMARSLTYSRQQGWTTIRTMIRSASFSRPNDARRRREEGTTVAAPLEYKRNKCIPLPFRVKEGKVGYYRSYVDLYWGDGEFLDAILRYTRVVQDVARWRQYVGGKGVHVLYACALIIIGI